MRHRLRHPVYRVVHVTAGVAALLVVTVVPRAAEAQTDLNRRREAQENRVARVEARIAPNDVNITGPADKRDRERRGHHSGKARDAAKHIGKMYFDIPEYHDEQHFQTSNTDFGPLVYLYASPFLGMYQNLGDIVEQGQFGSFAAQIEVEGTPGTALPPEYTNLNLQVGINCVWLANTGSINTGWVAYVTPASGLGECVRPLEGSAVPQLRVSRTSDRAKFTHADYPPVARFSEARFMAPQTYGQPLIGVKCLDGWCEIGPPTDSPRTVTLGPEFGRYGAIKGWHDEQVLALEDAAGVLRPSVRASLIPVPTLAATRLTTFPVINPTPVNSALGWVVVATIILDTDPAPGSKYERWGLLGGENYLYLRRITPTAGKEWQMSVINSRLPSRVIWENVTREAHTDVPVPATARWRFASFDPTGVWVRCGEACCSGDGGT